MVLTGNKKKPVRFIYIRLQLDKHENGVIEQFVYIGI